MWGKTLDIAEVEAAAAVTARSETFRRAFRPGLLLENFEILDAEIDWNDDDAQH